MSVWSDLRTVAAVFVPVMIAGCGGGGSSDGEDRVRYAGRTTQAVITEQNADIVVGGLTAGVPAALDLFGGTGVLFKDAAGGEVRGRGSLCDLGRLLSKPLNASLSGSRGGAERRASLITDAGSMPGSCGGEVDFRINVTETTGALSGTLTFSSDFCDEDVRISGTMAFTGGVDLVYLEILRLEMRTDRLDVRTADPSDDMDISMTGTVGIDAQDSEITLSVALRDNVTIRTVGFENFVVAYEDDPDGMTLTITGRYYDPAEGYVVFETETPVLVYGDDDGPSSGIVTALGAHQTKSRLTALTAETYRIDADLNGDGDYGDPNGDWSSDVLRWSDLDSRP